MTEDEVPEDRGLGLCSIKRSRRRKTEKEWSVMSWSLWCSGSLGSHAQRVSRWRKLSVSNIAGWSHDMKSEICRWGLAVWRLLEVVVAEEQTPDWAGSGEDGRRHVGGSEYKELLKGHCHKGDRERKS